MYLTQKKMLGLALILSFSNAATAGADRPNQIVGIPLTVVNQNMATSCDIQKRYTPTGEDADADLVPHPSRGTCDDLAKRLSDREPVKASLGMPVYDYQSVLFDDLLPPNDAQKACLGRQVNELRSALASFEMFPLRKELAPRHSVSCQIAYYVNNSDCKDRSEAIVRLRTFAHEVADNRVSQTVAGLFYDSQSNNGADTKRKIFVQAIMNSAGCQIISRADLIQALASAVKQPKTLVQAYSAILDEDGDGAATMNKYWGDANDPAYEIEKSKPGFVDSMHLDRN